jgi:hypothetical protein
VRIRQRPTQVFVKISAVLSGTPSGDATGTAPEDRPFRPDALGLRAIAILLVVHR